MAPRPKSVVYAKKAPLQPALLCVLGMDAFSVPFSPLIYQP